MCAYQGIRTLADITILLSSRKKAVQEEKCDTSQFKELQNESLHVSQLDILSDRLF